MTTELLDESQRPALSDEAQAQLAELQRDIDLQKKRWARGLRNRVHGSYDVPSARGGAIAAVGAVLFGIFWISMAIRIGAPAPFPLFGVVFIFVAVAGSLTAARRGKDASKFHRSMMERRREIFDRFRDDD